MALVWDFVSLSVVFSFCELGQQDVWASNEKEKKCCHGTMVKKVLPWYLEQQPHSRQHYYGYLDNTDHLLLWDDGCGGGISLQVTQVMVFFLLQH